MTGKVKWWIDSKGYGFLTGDDGVDVFVHYSDILGPGRKTLSEGQPVEFEMKENEKGPRAVNVQPRSIDGN